MEKKIAEFHGREDAILYPSCFDANAGLFEVLLTPDDAVISDELNHASIIDGIRLCKAQKYRYKHKDMSGRSTTKFFCRDVTFNFPNRFGGKVERSFEFPNETNCDGRRFQYGWQRSSPKSYWTAGRPLQSHDLHRRMSRNGFFRSDGQVFFGGPSFLLLSPLCSHMIDGPSPLIVPGVLRNTLVCPTEPISSTRPSEKLWVVRREGTRPARKN